MAACAVRTLARTDTFMPMKPVAPESIAPTANPNAVVPAESGHEADDEEDDHADHGDGPVLPVQVSLGSLLDGRRDGLHARIAGIQSEDPPARIKAVKHGADAAQKREPDCRRHKLVS